MTSTFWWHDGSDGSAAGPFTEQHIRLLLADGSLPPDVRIWSSRREPWPPSPAQVRPARDAGAYGRMVRWLLLSIPFWFGWLLFGFVVVLIQDHGAEPVDLRIHPWFWPAAGAGLILTALGLAIMWWTAPRRLGAGPELVAGLRIAAALAAAAWLLPAGIVLRDTPMVIKEAKALEDWSYLMSAGPDAHTLVVQGAIGAGFGRKLSQRLAALPDPARIIIESPGGLVDEALVAAGAIERRKAVVVVGGFCASACTIVLMAGRQRLAPSNGVITFHAAAPVIATSNALANWLAAQEGGRGRAYLLRRGVPAADVDEASRRGPRDVFAVLNPIALKQGVLTGLYDN